jgi:hypothetical protein
MTILMIIGMMAVLIVVGKRRKTFGFTEYSIVFLITLAQVLYFVFIFLTMEQPPRY